MKSNCIRKEVEWQVVKPTALQIGAMPFQNAVNIEVQKHNNILLKQKILQLAKKKEL